VSRRVLLGVLLLVSGIGGCLTVDRWEDARIESEVKAHLVAQKDANLTKLGVISRKATVYLNGTAESADERARAEQVAKDVRGVRGVVNKLSVESPSP
jgi:hyperosmotically inducible periplasmic protein